MRLHDAYAALFPVYLGDDVTDEDAFGRLAVGGGGGGGDVVRDLTIFIKKFRHIFYHFQLNTIFSSFSHLGSKYQRWNS